MNQTEIQARIEIVLYANELWKSYVLSIKDIYV